jgi:MFS superfamily sulfate permease-like transporter
LQFSASIPGIFYAMFGSSRQLNVGPEAALSLLVGQTIMEVMHHNHEKPEDLIAVGYKVATAITLQSGLFSFLLGFFRLGFIDVILSRALLSGFVAAVGVIILMWVPFLLRHQ